MGRKPSINKVNDEIDKINKLTELRGKKIEILKKINEHLNSICYNQSNSTNTYDVVQINQYASYFDDVTSTIQQNMVSVESSVSQELNHFDLNEILEKVYEEIPESEGGIFENSSYGLNFNENSERSDISFDDNIPIDLDITLNIEIIENFYFDYNIESLRNTNVGYQNQDQIFKENDDMNCLTSNAFEKSGYDDFLDLLIDNFEISTNNSLTHQDQVANIEIFLRQNINFQ